VNGKSIPHNSLEMEKKTLSTFYDAEKCFSIFSKRLCLFKNVIISAPLPPMHGST